MKISYAVILTAVLGVATGMGTAALRLGTSPWDGNLVDEGAHPGRPDLPLPGDPVPRVVVDHAEHNFGKMDADAEQSHVFVFTNRGDGKLVLTEGATSCKCTGVEIHSSEVLPGRSTKVTLKWTAKESSGPYQETAIIHTNDPQRRQVTLTISGRITESVRTVPPELVFYHVSANESTTRQIPLYCYSDQPMKIVSFKLSNQRIAEKFGVRFERLTPDQLEEEEDAQSGYLVRVTIKPGLPLGRFEQKILIATDLASAPAVVVPMRGKVTGDISIEGRDFNDTTGLLKLGTVNSESGVRRTLFLFARGPHRKEVSFNIVESDPRDQLRAELGETVEIAEGKSTQTPLLIEIPKGSRPATHLSSQQGKLGLIVIETHHPQIPELRIHVSFAVEGQKGIAPR